MKSAIKSAMRSPGPWIALVAVVVVAGVGGVWWLSQPGPAPAGQAAPPAIQAQPPEAVQAATPFVYSARTKLAETELKLPQALAAEPELHTRLYAEGVHDLKRFAEGAAAASAEEGEATPGMGPLTRTVTWALAGDTAKLLSLRRETYEFAGGAHPNTALDSLLWDKALKKPLQPAALIRRNADQARLDATLCQAVTDAKRQRLGAQYSPPGENWSCPKWSETALALAPSASPGKAGGLTFLFSPSSIGAYAEGPYEITLPQSSFRWALSPAYADEFAGAPKKLGDVTPKP